MRVDSAVSLAVNELNRATAKFGAMASPHEGYAILLEEVDELWDEVRRGSRRNMRDEAKQVAAMALRFLIDCCEEEPSLHFKTGDKVRLTDAGKEYVRTTGWCVKDEALSEVGVVLNSLGTLKVGFPTLRWQDTSRQYDLVIWSLQRMWSLKVEHVELIEGEVR